MSDLKPCPFCGKAPRPYGQSDVNGVNWAIEDRHVHIQGPVWVKCITDLCPASFTCVGLEEWNTRTDTLGERMTWNTDMEAACHSDEDIVVNYDDGTVLVFQQQYGGFNKAVYRAPSIPQPTKWAYLPPEGDE